MAGKMPDCGPTWVTAMPCVPARIAARFQDQLGDVGLQSCELDGVEAEGAPAATDYVGVVLFASFSEALVEWLNERKRRSGRPMLGVAFASGHGRESSGLSPDESWLSIGHGLNDVVTWDGSDDIGRQVAARLARWQLVAAAVADPAIAADLVGNAPSFRAVLLEAAEAALFTDVPVLVAGESGTGKELIAGLVDRLDPRTGRRGPVVVDCTTVVPELAGSEFFGHERGAFTGAVGQRDGAFALADGGTLFLDEVGELPPGLQAQLLRVIQEGTFKRVGGNSWHQTRFRLVCATNRDLQAMVSAGSFRADLYYRLAGVTLHLPPLRQRLEDILPLARHFAAQHAGTSRRTVKVDTAEAGPAETSGPEFSIAVERWLLAREYPGNVRELRQVVARLVQRWVGIGPITPGCIPQRDRPVALPPPDETGCTAMIEAGVRHALAAGAGLKEVGRLAEDTAFRIAVEECGSLQVAAKRLRVTDRALQLRRKAAEERA